MVHAILVKFGGSVARGGGGDPVLHDLATLAAAGAAVTIVHGGGPAVDVVLAERGIPIRRIDGLRVTDAATLAVVEEVIGRRVNTAIAEALVGVGATAQRVAGDDVFIAAPLHLAGADLGFVGEVVRVDTTPLRALLAHGAIPVVSPIGRDAAGQRYNINADTAAGALAAALGVDAYIVVTDVPRVRAVRDDPSTAIARMTIAQADAYRARGVFTDGMLPKIDAALAALRGGAKRAIICGAAPGSLPAALMTGAGTEIVA